MIGFETKQLLPTPVPMPEERGRESADKWREQSRFDFVLVTVKCFAGVRTTNLNVMIPPPNESADLTSSNLSVF
jgi:hypothetical protein